MIRLFILLFFLSLDVVSFAQDINEFRNEYYEATNNSAAADKFYEKIRSIDHPSPIFTAYYGSAQALKARYAWNPYNKMSYLNKGTKTLDAAVKQGPDNLEIRFLRFALEHYIPSFLGYSKHLEQDKKKIVQLIHEKKTGSINKSLLNNMIGFFKQSKRFTLQEMEILNHSIN